MAKQALELVDIGGGKRLPAAAARDYLAAVSEMQSALHSGPQVNSAYRSYDEQAALYNRFQGKQAVAKPGSSGHEWRGDLDVQNYQQARPYLERHGFKWANHKNDPVHFDYVGGGGNAAPTYSPQLSAPTIKPLPTLPTLVPFMDPIGSWEEEQARYNAGGGLYREGVQEKANKAIELQNKQFDKATSTPLTVQPVKTSYKQVKTGAEGFDVNNFINTIVEQNKPKPVEPQPADMGQQFMSGLGAGPQLYGPQTDADAARNGSSIPYQVGNFIGAAGVNLAGAGLGLLGGPVGSVAGGVAAGGLLSGGQELQRQRLQGEEVNYGKAAGSTLIGGGLNFMPAVGAGLKLLPRLGLNAGAQGFAQGVASIPLQAIEQGTFTPNIDIGRLGAESLLGSAGGAAGGLMTRGAAPKPKATRPAIQMGASVEAPQLRKPITLGGTLTPEVMAPLSTLDPTNPAAYALPEVPKVKQVEYAPVLAEGGQLPLFQSKGIDAALYDVATSTPETNPAAWAAAREGLKEYGDINIQTLGQQVKEIIDVTPEGQPRPAGVTERLVAPSNPKPIVDIAPKPQMPDQVIATTRQLKGTAEEMIAQGTAASPIKTQEQYRGVAKAHKDLSGGLTQYNLQMKNGGVDLTHLTPDEMLRRGGLLNDMLNTGDIPAGVKARESFQKSFQRVVDGNLTEAQRAKAQMNIASMEYRAELQALKDQLDTLHPEVKKAWDYDYDPKSGLAMQKQFNEGEKGLKLQRFEDVKEGLPESLYARLKIIEDATREGRSLKIDADTELTGATSNVSEREVTPIGAFKTKDGDVGFRAYNNEGHIAAYYITPKRNTETGFISQVKAVSPLGPEKFRGEYANVYFGPREFKVDELLKRPPRQDAVFSSQARQTLRQASRLMNDPELQALNPKVKEISDLLNKSPNSVSIEQVRMIEDLLTADKKVLQAACALLGRL